MRRTTTLAALTAVAALTMTSPMLTGCNNDKGPGEKAGRKVDKALGN